MQLLQSVTRLTIGLSLFDVSEKTPSTPFFHRPRSAGAVVRASVAESPLA